MAEPRKLRRSFRIGCRRRNKFRPVASVAISSDGGIIVAPADVPGQGWQYAVSRSAGFDDPIEISQVEERPKLHYHRSGIASITLTGHELERRGMRLSPVAETTGGQILSIVAIRPWELAVRESRKGDIATVHDKWPGDVTFMFQLVRYAKALPALDGVHEALSPLRIAPVRRQ